MAYEKLIGQVQALLDEGRIDEVVDLLFATYLQAHPTAQNILDYRDRVSYKLRHELAYLPDAEAKAEAKLLIYGFMTLVSNSEGETGYNIMLLLLHLMRRNQHAAIREIIEVLKLERASRNLASRQSL
jgi:hypothetical protein